MAISKVVVVDGNNLTVRIDRGVAGRGITDVQPIEIDNALYLEFFFSDGTTETVGPVGTIQYIGQAPIVVNASTISLSTVPINLGGTNATTAAAARTNLNAANQDTTISAGTGLSGGGSLAANRTISIANTAVTAASYGAASKTLTATVNAQGQLTALADTPIAIANTQISGLGTMSTQNANAVAITGGSITGITDLAVADGGTGASTAADARTNLNAANQDTTISAGTGLSGGGSLAANRTLSIANTAVTAGSYGSASNTLSATVNAQGQLTALAATPIAIANTQVSGLGTASTLNAGVALGVATLDAGGTVPLSQIPASIQGGVSYQGSWNAATNTPTIVSSVGTKGYYYVVSVAGSTNINGITDWLPGDWIIFNGSAWEQIDNTDTVQSVNGYVGAVVLNAADVGAPPTTRTITAGTGLSGGGDLSANRTISIDSTVVTLTGTQTLTNKTLTSPIVNEILDTNGNEILGLSPTASATDFLTVKNGIGVGVPLHIYADGSSTNVGLHIQPKGSGLVTISDGTDFNKGIRFRSSGSAAGVTTLIDAVSSAGHVVTLPNATTTLVGRDTTDTLTNKTFGDNPTFSAGTANGVAYLNGSKVLTSGSALTFDGTTLLALGGVTTGIGSGGNYLLRYTTANINSRTWRIGNDINVYGDFAIQQSTTQTGTTYRDVYTALNDGTSYWSVAGSEQMRLTSTGLGIGTSSPAQKLDVAGGNIQVRTGYSIISDTFTNYGAALTLNAAGSLPMYFALNGTAAMTLSAAGNLGIGTSSPANKLDVQGTSNTSARIWNIGGTIGNYAELKLNAYNSFSGQSQAYIRAISTASGNSGTALAFAVEDNGFGNPAEGMRLTSTGLGIGTSSPATKLVVSASGAAGLEVNPDGVGNAPALVAYNRSTSAYIQLTSLALQHVWNNSGTETMRLDSSGNLGLGVTPSAWSSDTVALQVGGSTFSAFAALARFLGLANARWDGTNFRYLGGGSAQQYRMSAGTGTHEWYVAPSGTAGNAISFTQSMTLDASGNLLVGTTSVSVPGIGFAFQIQGASSVASQMVTGHDTGASSGTGYSYFQYAGTAIGSITQSGTTAVLYNVTSDQRLKENIVDAPEFGSVIDSIKVRSYDWITDQTHQRAGFIAQELVTVAPEAVHQPADPEEMMAVDYSKLVPMLVKEIQSLRQRLAAAGI